MTDAKQMRKKYKVGVIGCGAISTTYLSNLSTKFAYLFDIYALADINREAATAKAEEYNVPNVYTVDELFDDANIDIVLNLTNPWAHYELNKRALECGKHVYCEKPLALTADMARELTEFAEEKGLAIGCAPDVYFGSGQQTTRQAIEAGLIGTPLTANATIIMNVDRPTYSLEGIGGAHMDMGPYFVAALVNIFGPVLRVSGSSRKIYKKRVIDDTQRPTYGESFDNEVDTTVVGLLEFANGMIATLTTTNDGYYYGPKFEIMGTKASFVSSDPNMFSGEMFLHEAFSDGAKLYEYPDKFPYTDNCRGIGLADMMLAWQDGRQWRANGHFATHIVDVLQSILESAKTGKRIEIANTCEQPEVIPDGKSSNPVDPSARF